MYRVSLLSHCLVDRASGHVQHITLLHMEMVMQLMWDQGLVHTAMCCVQVMLG